MFNELIKFLKEQAKISDQDYQNYLNFKKINENIIKLEEEKQKVLSEINTINKQLQLFSVLDKMFKSKELKPLMNRLKVLKSDLNSIDQSIEREKSNKEMFNFTPEFLSKVNEYEEILNVEQNFAIEKMEYDLEKMESMEKVSLFFLNKFDFDFNKLLDFCKKNGILLDFTSEKEVMFLDMFTRMRWKMAPSDPYRKISSLDDIILVRRTDAIPQDDTILSGSKHGTFHYEREVTLDNQKYIIAYESPLGLQTVHFVINQEVLPHKDAPEGWKDKKYTILQPLTEEIYKSVVSFEPMDTFTYGDVKLDDCYVICDSLEAAKEITTKNKEAFPIIVGKGKVYTFGDKIVDAMGVPTVNITKNYHGQMHDYTAAPLESCYSEELINSHSKLVTNSGLAEGKPEHEFGRSIMNCAYILESIDKLQGVIMSNNSFDDAMQMINRNLSTFVIPMDFGYAVQARLSFTDSLPEKYSYYGDFLDFMVKIADKKIVDPQIIFEKMCNGLEINESNINQLKIIKENVINLVNKYNSKVKESSGHSVYYNELASSLLLLCKITRTNIMELPVDKTHHYDVPLECYDIQKFEEQIKTVFYSFLNNGDTVEIAFQKLYNLFHENKLPEFDIPLQIPEPTDLLLRAVNLINNEYSNSDELEQIFKGILQDIVERTKKSGKFDVRDIQELAINVISYEEKLSLELNDSHKK